MRNPSRIPQLLNELQQIWLKYPDLRFWQLIDYLKHQVCTSDPFYIEDDKTLDVLKKIKEEMEETNAKL